MTTFHNDPFIDLPTPSDYELMSAPPPSFSPFVAVKRNRLVTIIAQTTQGLYVDRHGYLHRNEDLERDLKAYATRVRADARDHANTMLDALR